MKRTDSTEMDRLLRRHFRRDGETLRDASDREAQESKSAAHMDADEMNAYAEGALPEAARSRYFAHLADCDDCRKLVTELALASGAGSFEKRASVAEVPPSKSWREWLAALLSPPVLRYGVPALALFAVIIVAIVAMRARREGSYTAQNKEATRNSALSTSPSSNSAAETSTATTAEDHANANASSNSTTTAPAITEQSQTEISPAATPAPPKAAAEENTPVASPSIAAKNQAQSGGILDKKLEDRPEEEAKSNDALAGTAAAPQPAPPLAKPAPTDADDIAKRDEQRRKKVTTKEADETVTVTNGASVATTQTTAAESPRSRKAASRSTQNMAIMRPSSPASESSGAVSGKDKDNPSDTRTVGGHSFRRQGSAWVDTAYNSARPTISIARGSEQYRALLADEPGLRAIAQQLSGEVIVVWGNKAYRFH